MMAENLSRSGGASSGFDASALKRAIKQVNAAKAKATEMNGEAGALTKNAIEEHNFDKTAFTMAARLARKEPVDAQAIAGSFLTYCHALGLFDTSDLFQDHIKAMREIIAAVDAGASGASATVRKLSKGAEASAAAH